jgi:hypothetical protein
MGDFSGWQGEPHRVFAGLFLYRERGPPSRKAALKQLMMAENFPPRIPVLKKSPIRNRRGRATQA